MLLFIHMHKAAGSTVRRSAAKSGMTLPAGHRNGNVTVDGASVRYADLSSADTSALFERQRSLGVSFISSEHDMPDLEALPDFVHTFTVLRAPLSRAASNFRFYKATGHGDPNQSFRDLMSYSSRDSRRRLWASTNYYVRRFNRLNSAEPLDEGHLHKALETLKRLACTIVLGRDNMEAELKKLGICRIASTNISDQRKFSVQLSEEQSAITPDDEAWFKESNRFDIKLFDIVSKWPKSVAIPGLEEAGEVSLREFDQRRAAQAERKTAATEARKARKGSAQDRKVRASS